MSRSIRQIFHRVFVWSAILLITLQPTMAGHCHRRPLRHLIGKIKTMASCRPTCRQATSCTTTCYSAPTSCAGSYSTYSSAPVYSSPSSGYANEIIVSDGYTEGYSDGYTEDMIYESYPTYDAGYEVISDAGHENYAYSETVVENSGCSSCCGGDSYVSAPTDDGYASSYVSDGVVIEDGSSVVMEDSGYVDGGIIVEEGGYTVVDDGTYDRAPDVEESTPAWDGSGSRNAGSGAKTEMPQPAEVQAPADPAPVNAAPENQTDDDLGGDFMDEPAEEPADNDLKDDGEPADNGTSDDLLSEESNDDDMFGEEPAGDDMFDEEPAADPLDDANDALPQGDSDEPTVDEDLDDLFGATETAPVIEPIAMRTWTDNTGNYETVGQLETIGADFVRLLKANGHFSTVPMHRLSPADIEYVQLMAQRKGDTQLKFAAN